MTYVRTLKRIRSDKTNYRKRAAVIIGRHSFVTVKVTDQNVAAQMLKTTPTGDLVVASVHSRELAKQGWKGSIKSAAGTAGWKAKVDGNLVKFTTVKPVMAGKIANFKLKVSDTVHAISWSVVDKDGHVIDSNTAVIKARK